MKFLSDEWFAEMRHRMAGSEEIRKACLDRFAIIQIRVEQAESDSVEWHLALADDTADIRRGVAENPDARVIVSYDVAAAVHGGALDVALAFTDGLFEVALGAFVVADLDEFFVAYVGVASRVDCEY